MPKAVSCPLCDWLYVEPDVPVPPGTLANVFGPGVMTAVANGQRLQRIEEALRKHTDTHTALEYLEALTLIGRAVHRNEQQRGSHYSGFSTEEVIAIRRAAGLK